MIEAKQLDLASDDSDQALPVYQPFASDSFRKIGVFRDGLLEQVAFYAIGSTDDFRSLRVAEDCLFLLLGGFGYVLRQGHDVVCLPKQNEVASVECFPCPVCQAVCAFGYSTGYAVTSTGVFSFDNFPAYGVDRMECLHTAVKVWVSRDLPSEEIEEIWQLSSCFPGSP